MSRKLQRRCDSLAQPLITRDIPCCLLTHVPPHLLGLCCLVPVISFVLHVPVKMPPELSGVLAADASPQGE